MAPTIDKPTVLTNLNAMRLILSALLCSLFLGCASSKKPVVTSVTIEEIKPRYMETEQFKRISEYMTGKEHTGDRMILRSVASERAGYYFTLILDEDIRSLPKGTRIIGEFYTPKSTEIERHEFILSSKRPDTNEIFVGLTGEDWPIKDRVPAAWRFTIEDANGNLMGRKQSYLWSL